MTAFVLDNSVAMRWFFEAGAHPYADGVLHDLASSTSQALVPVLWCYEVSSVLARAQNKGAVAEQEVADFIEDLAALPIRVEDQSSHLIFTDVHRLAVTHRLTSYDAAYLELARRLGLPLATLDAELIAVCRHTGVPLR